MSVVDLSIEQNSGTLQIHLQGLKLRFRNRHESPAGDRVIATNGEVNLISLSSCTLTLQIQLIGAHRLLGVQVAGFDNENTRCTVEITDNFVEALQEEHCKWLSHSISVEKSKDSTETKLPTLKILEMLFVGKFTMQRDTRRRNGDDHENVLQLVVNAKRVEISRACNSAEKILGEDNANHDHAQTEQKVMKSELEEIRLDSISETGLHNILLVQKSHLHMIIGSGSANEISGTTDKFILTMEPFINDIISIGMTIQARPKSFKKQAGLNDTNPVIAEKHLPKRITTAWKFDCKVCSAEIRMLLGRNEESNEMETSNEFEGVKLSALEFHLQTNKRKSFKKDELHEDQILHFYRLQFELTMKNLSESLSYTIVLYDVKMIRTNNHQCLQSIHACGHDNGSGLAMCSEISYILRRIILEASSCSIRRKSNTFLEASESSPFAEFDKIDFIHETNIRQKEDKAGEKTVQVNVQSQSTKVEINCREFEKMLQDIANTGILLHHLSSLYFQVQPHRISNTTPIDETRQIIIRSKILTVKLLDMEGVAESVLFESYDFDFKAEKDSTTQIQEVSSDIFEVNWNDTLKVSTIEKLALVRTEINAPDNVHICPIVNLCAAKIHINVREEVKLPLMFLRMDHMFNYQMKKYIKTTIPRDLCQDTSVQANLQFGLLCVDLLGCTYADQIQVVSSIALEDLQMRCKAHKGHQMTYSIRSMLRLAEKEKLDTLEESFIWSSLSSIDRLQGSMTTKSLAINLEQDLNIARCRPELGAPFMSICGGSVQLCLSDIKWTVAKAPESMKFLPPRQIFFDVSMYFDSCSMHFVERMRLQQLIQAMKIIQCSINTNQEKTDEKSAEVTFWMNRIFGNMNVTCTALQLTIPYRIQEDHKNVDQYRNVLIRASQSEFTCHQLQCCLISMDSLDVVLTEASTSFPEYKSAGYKNKDDIQDDFQLLCLPNISLRSGLLWRATQFVDAPEGDQSIHVVSTFQFSIRHSSSPESDAFETQEPGLFNRKTPSKVPYNTSAFLGLNWDRVYPLLAYFLAGESREDAHDPSSETSVQSTKQQTYIASCAVHWNISIDILQMLWWDGYQQDVAVLCFVKDVLTQGVVKFCRGNDRRKKCTKGFVYGPANCAYERYAPLDLTYGAFSLIVNLLRCYILQKDEDETSGGEVGLSAFGIPFEHTPVNTFILESTGSSYRATYQNHPLGQADGGHDRDGLLQKPSKFSLNPSLGQRFHPPYQSILPTSKSVANVHPLTLKPVDSASSSCKKYASSNPTMMTADFAEYIAEQPPLSLSKQTDISSIASGLKECSCLLNDTEDKADIWPIQVESMKLHWTLKSRDTVFYMITTIVDTLHEIKQRMSETSEGRKSMTTKGVTLNFVESQNLDVDRNSKDSTIRFDVKESLLELLQQGRLGLKEDDQTHQSKRESYGNEFERKKSSYSLNADLIAFKKYTIDIHNAQINVSDESSKSSILVASKHIHVAGGKDRLQGDAIASFAFEHVTVHVAPIDVDIAAEPQWWRQQAVRQTNAFDGPVSPRGSQKYTARDTSSPFVLKQVLEECELNVTYIQTIATGASSAEVNLSFLKLSTDRHQFYQLLNVVRHVLLAPPRFVHRGRRHRTNRSSFSTETSSMEAPHRNTATSPTPAGKRFYAQLEEELRCRESKTLSKNLRTSPNALKCITFHAVGGRFLLRASPNSMACNDSEADFIELCLERINGSHTFYENQRTKLFINLHWLEINNLRSGPKSSVFEDVSSVMRAKLMIENRFEARDKIPFADEKGMLTIRAESGPLMRFWGKKIRVQDLLEISIFPDIPYVIVIQLAADFYDLICKFLFDHGGGQQEFSQTMEPEQALFGRKVSQPSGTGTHAAAANSTSPPASPKSKKTVPTSKSSSLVQRLSQHNNSSSSSTSTSRFRSRNSSAASTAVTTNALEEHEKEPLTSSQEEDELYSTSNEQELFYFKYVRIGNIRLCINCNGFFVNLSGLELDLPPYICQGRLSTYKKMLQRFENHLKWHVTKLTASSGLSHFRNKFLKWTPINIAATSSHPISSTGLTLRSSNVLSLAEEKSEDNAQSCNLESEEALYSKVQGNEEDVQEDAHNAQVLFGPYYKPRKV
uniref:Uncharacterized protein AlNc14C1G84 n=1 Tax=Albugo laibachii Nc14 TaxID=890382 RepID=F0VYT2_9STRA|nr:conserved hypothetical protein [Albugo laibachii Nc14]|eukprot:CCA13947.1 conserved hypothetical protein [Albugo laibachii Nc14]